MNKFFKVIDFFRREIVIHFIMLFTAVLPNTYVTTQIRGYLIGKCIGKCGKNFRVASGVIINKPSRLFIGDNVYIAHNVWINAVGNLTIESNSVIGPFSVLVTSKHTFENSQVTHVAAMAPIIIKRGVWLASHVVVTDGVTVGSGALIAAGAVVTHDVKDNSMVGGIPAKEIKVMKPDEESNNEV